MENGSKMLHWLKGHVWDKMFYQKLGSGLEEVSCNLRLQYSFCGF